MIPASLPDDLLQDQPPPAVLMPSETSYPHCDGKLADASSKKARVYGMGNVYEGMVVVFLSPYFLSCWI